MVVDKRMSIATSQPLLAGSILESLSTKLSDNEDLAMPNYLALAEEVGELARGGSALVEESAAASNAIVKEWLATTAAPKMVPSIASSKQLMILDPLTQADVAVASASSDGGAALKALQQRFESAAALIEPTGGDVEQITFSRAVVPSGPSGDFMKVVRADGKIHYILGDVENHGLPAAFQSVKTHAALEANHLTEKLAVPSNEMASDGLAVIDETVYPYEKTFSVSHLMLDPKTGLLEHAGAGSEAYVLHPDGTVVELESGAPLMGGRYFRYGELGTLNSKLQLHPGDTAIMMTDGIYENRMWKSGLDELLKKAAMNGSSPLEINSQLTNPLIPYEDDASMFIVRWPGPKLSVQTRAIGLARSTASTAEV